MRPKKLIRMQEGDEANLVDDLLWIYQRTPHLVKVKLIGKIDEAHAYEVTYAVGGNIKVMHLFPLQGGAGYVVTRGSYPPAIAGQSPVGKTLSEMIVQAEILS